MSRSDAGGERRVSAMSLASMTDATGAGSGGAGGSAGDGSGGSSSSGRNHTRTITTCTCRVGSSDEDGDSLVVFAAFSVLYLKEPITWNYAVGFVLVAAGAFFIFRGPL